ncbi:MAG: MbnP family protein, partial [Bacteroidota bacterium]
LDYALINVTGPDNSITSFREELEGKSQNLSNSFNLLYAESGTIVLTIDVFDAAGNQGTAERFYEYVYDPSGTIDFNIKLQYNSEPLVLFEPFIYPDGRSIDFTRISFYISEVTLDDENIVNVEFHNLTDSHATSILASQGYNWTVEGVPPGFFSTLSFNIGVPAELNEKDPGEFPSGHPLAKPSENWFGWKSFVFLKVEGNMDMDGDGTRETGIALHTGADEALRNISLDNPILINDGERTEIDIVFDVYDLFDGQNRIFPIDDFAQIHSLSQIDAVNELSDNLTNAIKN